MGDQETKSPQTFGQIVKLFLDVKNNVPARIAEPSNDDYDNGGDNCDFYLGTFGDFGVKNYRQESCYKIHII